jgi:hypothetical protein
MNRAAKEITAAAMPIATSADSLFIIAIPIAIRLL